MGDNDRRESRLALERVKLSLELAANRHVERREGLVEQEDLGRTAQCLGQGHALTLPSRELGGVVVLQPLELQVRQPVPSDPGTGVGREHQVAPHRQVGEQGETLRDVTDTALLGFQRAHVVLAEGDCAHCGAIDASEGP